VAGAAVIAGLLYWAGSDAVVAALQRCRPMDVAATGLIVALATVLGAWNCHRIAELDRTVSFPEFLPLFWRSWAVGITMPGQVADFLATLWQLHGRAKDLNFVAGRLLADKAVTLSLTLALLALLPFVLGPGRFHVGGLEVGAIVGVAIVVICALGYVLRRSALRARVWRSRAIAPIAAGLRVPFKLLVANTLVTCAKLLLSGLAYWTILRAVSPDTPDLLTSTVISQTAGLVAYLPISFNGLGTVELSAIALFGACGMDRASILSAYLILRATTMAAAWTPALLFTLRKSLAAAVR
jgi:uncharacterized membrane protein YbhN (UPF0104 family)